MTCGNINNNAVRVMRSGRQKKAYWVGKNIYATTWYCAINMVTDSYCAHAD